MKTFNEWLNENFNPNSVAFMDFEYPMASGFFLNPSKSLRGQNVEGLLIVDRNQADHYIFSITDELKKELERSKQDKNNNSGINLWRTKLQKAVMDFNSITNQTKEKLQKINNGKNGQEKTINGDLMLAQNFEDQLTNLNIELEKRMGKTGGGVPPIKRSYDSLR